MDHSLVYLNETIGHDLQDHPKRMGSGGGFWKKKKKKTGPPEKGMENLFSILVLRTPGTA